MPPVRLSPDAVAMLESYRWPGNIRQLKNVTEQVSVIESERDINGPKLAVYLPDSQTSKLPMVIEKENQSDLSEREILYKIIFEMRNEVQDLKKLVSGMIRNDDSSFDEAAYKRLYPVINPSNESSPATSKETYDFEISRAEPVYDQDDAIYDPEVVEESLSIEEKEKELIKKALDKLRGRRKKAAQERGISERTLYRKIKEYELN